MPVRWIINLMLMPLLLIAVVCAALVAISIASYDELLERARRFRQS
jgi:Tfp pilus assembly protein PilE